MLLERKTEVKEQLPGIFYNGMWWNPLISIVTIIYLFLKALRNLKINRSGSKDAKNPEDIKKAPRCVILTPQRLCDEWEKSRLSVL
jgi:hypothetical protein